MLQNNPYKLTSQVALAPDPQLASMMERYKNTGDAVAFSVVFNEVQRRKEVRDAAQSKMMGSPKQKVADQLIQEAKMAHMPSPPPPPQGGPQGGTPPGMGMPPQGGPQGGPPPGMEMPPQGGPQGGPPPGMEMPPEMAMGPQGGPPQGLPEQSGIGQLPAPNIANMAGGGIVSFAYGGSADVPLGTDLYQEGNELDPRFLDYNAPDETYPSEETTDEAPAPAPEDSEYSSEGLEALLNRFAPGDSAGEFRRNVEGIIKGQEKDSETYQKNLEDLGPAYAGAEARNKELEQRYAEEAGRQQGLPLIRAGAKLMQSRAQGISGIGELIENYAAESEKGRDKLAALQDQMRDYMQTVQEARRAEKRGDVTQAYGLKKEAAGQRISMEGVAAQLGQGDRQIRATLGASLGSAMVKGQTDPGLDKLASRYIEQADMYEAAASNSRNDSRKSEFLALANQYRKKGNELIDRIKNNQFALATQTSKYLQENTQQLRSAISLLNNPETYNSGMQMLNALGAGYPGGAVSGEYLLELIQNNQGGTEARSVGSGPAEVYNFSTLAREDEE